MTKDWANEPWIKLYTHKSLKDRKLSEAAKLVWYETLQAADKSGIIPLDTDGLESLHLAIELSYETTQKGIVELLRDGRVRLCADSLVIPNYIEAQRARKSQRQRSQDLRDRRRSDALLSKILKDERESESDGTSESEAQREVEQRNANSLPLFSSLSSPLFFPDPVSLFAKQDSPPEVTSPIQVAFPGESSRAPAERSLLARHREAVRALWELQEELREGAATSIGETNERSPLTAAAALVVARRLEAGASQEDCERALKACAAEVRKKRTLQWFDRISHWESDRTFQRKLSEYRPPVRYVEPAPPPPAPVESGERASKEDIERFMQSLGVGV